MSVALDTLLVRTDDTCGGKLRVEGTRITVLQLALLYRRGLTPEEIADQYPHLSLAQVYAALAYYHANREEIEAAWQQEEEDARRLEQHFADRSGN